MPLITIIIPTYNTGHFLSECLDSILNQSFKDFEIIVIDDGSTDNTPTLLSGYIAREKRLTMISQKNAGQGAARNRAIGQAHGAYIMFLDADDMLAPEALTSLEKLTVQHPDIVHFDWKFFTPTETGVTYEYLDSDPTLKMDVLMGPACDALIQVPNFFSFPNLFRRDFLLDHDIRFGEGYIYEDNELMVKAATRAESIVFIHEPFVLYRKMNNNSSSRSGYTTDRHAKDFIRAVKASLEAFHPRTERSAYDIARYFVTKSIIYYEHRIPRRYRKQFIRDFVDALSNLDIKIPTQIDTPDRILRTAVNMQVFSRRRYNLYHWLVRTKVLSSKIHRVFGH